MKKTDQPSGFAKLVTQRQQFHHPWKYTDGNTYWCASQTCKLSQIEFERQAMKSLSKLGFQCKSYQDGTMVLEYPNSYWKVDGCVVVKSNTIASSDTVTLSTVFITSSFFARVSAQRHFRSLGNMLRGCGERALLVAS